MSTWQEKIPACFGCDDKKFGRHALDEDRAKELKKQLDQEGVVWATVEIEIRGHLAGCMPDHIETEVREAKKFLCLNEERK